HDNIKMAVMPLATKTELNDSIKEAVKPLATKTELDAAVKPLATKTELNDSIKEAVKLLATKEAVKLLATKESVDALSVRITDFIKAIALAIDALGVRITDSNKANTEAIEANRVLIENSQFWFKILIPFLMLIITLFVVREGIQIYDARSTSLSPAPIESADPSTPKQPEPSPGASSATGTEQTLETNSKTTVLPE
nr:hypothetical protein [Gammaproteobacteria bacterium]